MKETEEELKGILKYYDDEIEVLFPNDFETFQIKLGEMLNLNENIFNNVNLFFKDKNGNNAKITNLQDYESFIKNIKERKDLVILTVEIIDQSESYNKKLSNSKASFKERINFQNINNFNKNLNNNNMQIDNNNNFRNNNINIQDNLINNIKNKDIHPIDEGMPKISNNRNKYINNINNNQINNSEIQQQNIYNNNLSCSFPCFFCKKSQIYNVIYYCDKCNEVFCSNCEKRIGPIHNHAYLKIQNQMQYDSLYLNQKLKFKKFVSEVSNKIEGTYKDIINHFTNDANQGNILNNNRNNCQIELMERNDLNNLVQATRALYDLRNINDQQIKDALIKSNRDIDAAIILLTTNNYN